MKRLLICIISLSLILGYCCPIVASAAETNTIGNEKFSLNYIGENGTIKEIGTVKDAETEIENPAYLVTLPAGSSVEDFETLGFTSQDDIYINEEFYSKSDEHTKAVVDDESAYYRNADFTNELYSDNFGNLTVSGNVPNDGVKGFIVFLFEDLFYEDFTVVYVQIEDKDISLNNTIGNEKFRLNYIGGNGTIEEIGTVKDVETEIENPAYLVTLPAGSSVEDFETLGFTSQDDIYINEEFYSKSDEHTKAVVDDESVYYRNADFTNELYSDNFGNLLISGDVPNIGVKGFVVFLFEDLFYEDFIVVYVQISDVVTEESQVFFEMGKASGLGGTVIEVPVAIKQNQGFSYMEAIIEYDSTVMSFEGIDSSYVDADITENKIVFVQDSDLSDERINDFATLQFKIKEDAGTGNYTVGMTVSSIIDAEGNNVLSNVKAGKVTVEEPYYIACMSDGTDGLTLGDVATVALNLSYAIPGFVSTYKSAYFEIEYDKSDRKDTIEFVEPEESEFVFDTASTPGTLIIKSKDGSEKNLADGITLTFRPSKIYNDEYGKPRVNWPITLKKALISKDEIADPLSSKAATVENGSANINVSRFTVSLSDGITGEPYVTPGEDYQFSLADQDKYEYIISETSNDATYMKIGGARKNLTYMKPNAEGVYTIPSYEIQGNIEFFTKRTPRSFAVTCSEGITGEATATYGTDYSFAVESKDGYDSVVAVTVGGEEYTAFTQDGESITIPGADITGEIVVSVTYTTTEQDVFAIISQPSDTNALAGEAVSYSVKATAAESYQWYYSKDGQKWYKSTISSSNTDTVSFKVSKTNLANSYKCKVTGKDGTVLWSDTVRNTVADTALVITAQPVNHDLETGKTATYTVQAVNAVSYQWYYSKDNGQHWYKTTLQSAENEEMTESSITMKASASNMNNVYSCKITGADGIVIRTETVGIVNAPVITEQPADQTGKAGDSISYSVTAENAENYQWYYSKDGQKWYKSTLSTAATDTLSFKAAKANMENQYKCKVTGKQGLVLWTDIVQMTAAE